MQMVQLIYASRFSKGVGPNDVQTILNVSRKNNEAKGVTGVLCYDPRFFLQCLEGPRDAVNELYCGIVGDARHKDVTLLRYSEVSQRAFENWSMAYVMADKITSQILLKFSTGRKFDPFGMSAEQALGLIMEIARARQEYLEHIADDEKP